MKNSRDQLTKLVPFVKQIEITPLMKERLGQFADEAAENSKQINVYLFKYEVDGKKIQGFLIEPKVIKEKLPVIVYNRGGNRDFGLIMPGNLFTNIGNMVRWGYAVMGTQYPGNKVSEGRDEFGGSDVKSILELYPIIKKLSTLDEKKVGMYGASRGGMMLYQCLTQVDWIKAGVSVAGMANMVRSEELRPEMVQVHKETFGGEGQDLKKRSAVFWPEKFSKTSPLLMMHGTADWRVSPLDSLELSIGLYKNKIPNRLVIFEGGDHGLNEYKDEQMNMAREWFDKYLKESKPLPDLEPHGR